MYGRPATHLWDGHNGDAMPLVIAEWRAINEDISIVCGEFWRHLGCWGLCFCSSDICSLKLRELGKKRLRKCVVGKRDDWRERYLSG